MRNIVLLLWLALAPLPARAAEETAAQAFDQVFSNLAKSMADVYAACKDYPAALRACKPYACTYKHPFTGEPIQKGILGERDGACLTMEQMPQGQKMECALTLEMRQAVAQEYSDMASGKLSGGNIGGGVAKGEANAKSTYTIDGKKVSSPSQEAINDEQCRVVAAPKAPAAPPVAAVPAPPAAPQQQMVSPDGKLAVGMAVADAAGRKGTIVLIGAGGLTVLVQQADGKKVLRRAAELSPVR